MDPLEIFNVYGGWSCPLNLFLWRSRGCPRVTLHKMTNDLQLSSKKTRHVCIHKKASPKKKGSTYIETHSSIYMYTHIGI
jgi:hypothetical protein